MLVLLLVLLLLQPGCTYSSSRDTADAVLYEARQSSTLCESRCTFCTSICYEAQLALNNNWDYASLTTDGSSEAWWEARMATIIVQKIELKVSTWSRSPESTLITVSLHKAGKLAGRCQPVVNDGSAQALQCDRVAADKVKVTVQSTDNTKLYVYGISVIPAVPANCSKPITGLLNGKLTPSTDIASGANFTLTCNHGSVLTGPGTIKCSDGTLSSPSGCMPVASFAQSSYNPGTVKDTLVSPDKAIDNDPSTYARINSTPWGEIPTAGLKVYFKAIVEVESVTFTAYCFSDEDQFTVSMVYKDEDNSRSCGSSRCDSYGEVTKTIGIRCKQARTVPHSDKSGHVLKLDYKSKKASPLILFDINWSG